MSPRLPLLLVACAIAASAAPCSYKTPTVEEVVTGVVLTEPEDEELPVDPEDEDSLSRSRRQLFPRPHRPTLDQIYRRLRIKLHFDTSIDRLSRDKQAFVRSSLLPAAVGYWERALSVRRSSAPIRLNRKCEGSQYYLHPGESRQSCAGDCKNVTKCGEVDVPDFHLLQCRYCSSHLPSSCGVKGEGDGLGVNEADFLFYVSAVPSARCDNAETVAYAAHCQQESILDRPIAGHVNLCPESVSSDPKDQEVLLSTVKHEILHALGFSAGLYAFYRDERGSPRTPRNEYGKPLHLNKEKGYYDWDSSTVRKVERDWWTRTGRTRHSVDVLVTPRVVREARAHFACGDLEGAELENQGLDGTALTHWEKRLFENEAMTGTHTQNPVYSRLTLALMEDSGWYRADYSVAEHLGWGSGLGCSFATTSCGSWIKERLEKGRDPAPFCASVKGAPASATTCTASRDSVALCNLVEYDKYLPRDYQEFEWKNDSRSLVKRDSRCEFESNTPVGLTNAALEYYSHDSRCIQHEGKWRQRKCGYTRTFQHYGAGCYEYHCQDGRLWLSVLNGSSLYPCYAQGQRIVVRQIRLGWLHEGALVCPACSELCPSSFSCLPDRGTAPPIGDPPLAEPCSAPGLSAPLLLPWTLLLFRGG